MGMQVVVFCVVAVAQCSLFWLFSYDSEEHVVFIFRAEVRRLRKWMFCMQG